MFHTKNIVQNIYFPDHDAVRMVFQKNEVDFMVNKNNWCQMLLDKYQDLNMKSKFIKKGGICCKWLACPFIRKLTGYSLKLMSFICFKL